MNIFNRNPVFVSQYREMTNDELKRACLDGYLFFHGKKNVDPSPDRKNLARIIEKHAEETGLENVSACQVVNLCFKEYYRRSMIGEI